MADMVALMKKLNDGTHRAVLVIRGPSAPTQAEKEPDMSKNKKPKAVKKSKVARQNEAVAKRMMKKMVAKVDARHAAPAKVERVKTPMEIPAGDKTKRMSGLDAAAFVLSKAGTPLSAREIFDATQTSELWTSKGKTPDATLYAAMIREIAAKKDASRFRKSGPGLFEFAKK